MKKTYSTPEMEEIVLSNLMLTNVIKNSIVDDDSDDEWNAVKP